MVINIAEHNTEKTNRVARIVAVLVLQAIAKREHLTGYMVRKTLIAEVAKV